MRQPGVHIKLAISQTSYSEQVDNICFRIAQEALNNAMKHGAPGQIEITIESTARELVMTVMDNGLGQRSAPSHGFGLSGMRERIRAAGGSLESGNRQDAPGFAIHARLPLAERPATEADGRTAALSKGNSAHEAAHH